MEPSTTAFGESANKWGYRPQLDGLRAVAVYLVLAYHAGSWRLQGGFVGVDLFFVLSGFLVTNVILAELVDQGHLRLRRFYARRVRRLIPAASLAIVGTSLAALLIANPLDRSSWSGDATASSCGTQTGTSSAKRTTTSCPTTQRAQSSTSGHSPSRSSSTSRFLHS